MLTSGYILTSVLKINLSWHESHDQIPKNKFKEWNGTIHLYERKSDFLQTDLGGGVQVSGGSTVLRKLGLLEQFRKIAQPITGVLSRSVNLDTLFELDIFDSINKNKILNKDLYCMIQLRMTFA